MNYPKVIFKCSWIYDQTWKESLIGKKVRKYPSFKKILSYTEKIERLWRKDEKKVLQEIAKITHLKWRSKSIDCYVVGRCRPFSYPLTMPIYEKHPDLFIDVLIHELIHNILTQNREKIKRAFEYINKKYKKETPRTKNHIYVHAIHNHIYLKFYNKNRLKRDIGFSKLDFQKSWAIIQKEVYKNIINEFVKRIK